MNETYEAILNIIQWKLAHTSFRKSVLSALSTQLESMFRWSVQLNLFPLEKMKEAILTCDVGFRGISLCLMMSFHLNVLDYHIAYVNITVTRNFDIFFDLRLNKRLSKQSSVCWFETPSRPLWRHFNEIGVSHFLIPAKFIRLSILQYFTAKCPFNSKPRCFFCEILL